ncbi:hypothetical protein ACFFK0_26630 [Paenibacillus chartarius]|uniref:CRISPR-associated protein n=1 Tax=Paenibacillus chartarius TaxID=747481 RepID=A0ABV6DTK3_9BACL
MSNVYLYATVIGINLINQVNIRELYNRIVQTEQTGNWDYEQWEHKVHQELLLHGAQQAPTLFEVTGCLNFIENKEPDKLIFVSLLNRSPECYFCYAIMKHYFTCQVPVMHIEIGLDTETKDENKIFRDILELIRIINREGPDTIGFHIATGLRQYLPYFFYIESILGARSSLIDPNLSKEDFQWNTLLNFDLGKKQQTELLYFFEKVMAKDFRMEKRGSLIGRYIAKFSRKTEPVVSGEAVYVPEDFLRSNMNTDPTIKLILESIFTKQNMTDEEGNKLFILNTQGKIFWELYPYILKNARRGRA